MHFKDLKNRDQIYTFVDKKGVNTHIDSVGLREWCLNTPSLEVFWIPIDKKFAKQMQDSNSVSIERIIELLFRELDPIIMVKDGTYKVGKGPNVMLVDGHHRYMFAYIAKQPVIPGYLLEPEQWEPFRVEGYPDMTMEQLRRLPIPRRNY